MFWVHASNAERIEQGYCEIAERVKIRGRKNPKENIFELVARWLRDEKIGRWLLVLDSIDDDAVLSTPQAATRGLKSDNKESQLTRPLSAYLPQSAHGAILITTRTQNVAAQLVEPQDMVPVEPMVGTDAIALLKKKLGMQIDDRNVGKLARILEYMPLAIVQAAAYIQQKGPRYSVDQYIEAFQRNDNLKTSLLNFEAGHLRRDPEARNSIIITWQLTFDHIRKEWPLSADLLSLMSFFDPQGIPEEALKVQTRNKTHEDDNNEDTPDDSTSEGSDDKQFEEAMERLRSYSLVSIEKDGRTFKMHALVQLATRNWLKVHRKDKRWKEEFFIKLNMVFPQVQCDNRAQCKKLLPHAKSAEMQPPVSNGAIREWAQILRKAGWYALTKGDHQEAETMSGKSVTALTKVFGREDIETSYSLGLLASTYYYQERWEEAEKLGVQVMKIRLKVLGQKHPDTLSSMDNLGSTYVKQERWTEAEELDVQVMETCLRVLGQEHPDTLKGMNNLAETLRSQGRNEEALKLTTECVSVPTKSLGEDHPEAKFCVTRFKSVANPWRDPKIAALTG